ncbi:hypothetical protein Pmani_019150 [Petrolisthes manimaculis]|uniref:Uncharacterized protein n=1 Tax=Petrolisthes manimaculis TaxID=1843537 RepID=A0AAE1PL24_9EUCA|nr:hypothetical protein Pmani_019150 [Petrolisthes manimaculis]
MVLMGRGRCGRIGDVDVEGEKEDGEEYVVLMQRGKEEEGEGEAVLILRDGEGEGEGRDVLMKREGKDGC